MTLKLIARNQITPIFSKVLRTTARQGYNLRSLLHYCHIFLTFILHAPLFSELLLLFDSQLRWGRWLLSFIVDDSAYPRLANSISDFLQIFTKTLQKSQKYFSLLCNSKEESRTVNYGTTQCKSRRKLKSPRRPTEPSDLLDFEKTARLRQQPQPFRSFLHGPRFI